MPNAVKSSSPDLRQPANVDTLLALDLGQHTGWALAPRSACASGANAPFPPSKKE
jgi:hypothetical protein